MLRNNMEYYYFNDEETAIAAESWICAKATELGIGFKKNIEDVTDCFAIPIPELDQNNEHTGRYYFQRIPDDVREKINESDIIEFLTIFKPSIESL